MPLRVAPRAWIDGEAEGEGDREGEAEGDAAAPSPAAASGSGSSSWRLFGGARAAAKSPRTAGTQQQ